MISEMRALVKEIRKEADLPTHDAWDDGYRVALDNCADRIEALLARTEAVADGADLRETLDDRLDWLKKVSGPAKAFQASNVVVRLSTAEESLRMLFAASLRTHHQDASGDAVAELIAAADVLNTGAKHGLGTYPEDWKRLDAALDAMQAKEAK